MAREKEIEIDTRLGRRLIDPEKIIHFPRGLAGFEDEHDFILLQLRPDAPMLILQSVGNPKVGLLVADPYSFLPDYSVRADDAEKKLLKISREEDASILVTVSIPPGVPQDAALNLTGPIFINHREHIGLQIPQGFEGIGQVRLQDLSEGSQASPTEEVK